MKTRAPRYRVGELSFICDTGESSWAAPLIDVSETGMFLETANTLQVGTRVTLIPDVPDNEKLHFEIPAEVIRINELDAVVRPPGIAFRLLNLSPAQYSELKRFLDRRGVLVRPPKE
jgi:Tfp pilus assembly protein PilZ